MTNQPLMPIEDSDLDPMEQVTDLLAGGDAVGAGGVLGDLHPSEAAYVLERLTDDQLEDVVPTLEPDHLADTIEFADAGTRADIARMMEPEQLAETIESMPDDLATDMVQDLDDRVAAQVMEALSEGRREELEELLTYPEQTAGGRMTGQLITVRPTLTAGQTIESLRGSETDASKPFYVYVTEQDRTLLGVVNVRSLLTAQPSTPIADLMTTNVIAVEASTDQEEAAHVLQRHNLLALPVVDAHGHLLGTITSDDLIDVLEAEATEDLYRLAFVHEDEDLRGVWSSVRNRLPWLTVNLGTALAAAWVVSGFEDTLQQVAILAAFLPVIGGQGGNAGIQTLTVVIRSMAIGRVNIADTWTLLWHEFQVGVILGCTTGVMVGLVAWAWRGNAWLGLIVLAALVANTIVGAVSGVLIPMALQRLKQDPALSGGVWLTTATDLSGFFAFLATATVLIDRLDP